MGRNLYRVDLAIQANRDSVKKLKMLFSRHSETSLGDIIIVSESEFTEF
jgi:hypothetical protein